MTDTSTQTVPLTFEDKVAKSSQVTSVTYNPERRVLSVIFKNQKTTGAAPQFMYEYADFPPEKWAELQACESIGSYLYRNVTRMIAGQMPYQFTKIDISREGANG